MTHISDCGGVDPPIICVVCHGNDVVWTSHIDDADMGHGRQRAQDCGGAVRVEISD